MPAASIRAIAADLLGDDPYAARRGPVRLPLADAMRACPRGEVAAAMAGDAPVAVVTLDDGRQFVVPDACPHDGGLLSDGYVEGGRLVCARHGWEFDVATGQCAGRAICLETAPLARRGRAIP